MSEVRRLIESRLARTIFGLAAVTGSVALGGCGDSGATRVEEPSSATSSTIQTTESVTMQLDFTKLNANGEGCTDPETPRPCWAPIRSVPQTDTGTVPFLNAVYGPELKPEWPYEPFEEKPGDEIDVVCQVRGDKLRTSRLWNVVVMPVEYVDPLVLDMIKTGEIKIGTLTDSGEITDVLGYYPDYWMGNRGVRKELASCTDTQNPAGHPSAK